ncbi:right-handed parallel beta-helix repeat-containing protein [Massilia oculi]|uniref:Right-handed parallel beta-helix repeat-containing protein n=1 Tax=Massilia hydrophila TaxID=3044279 RepID=A0ABS7Y838_9BURK|nr:right-handed parallel beta-helix repeat-containing protein [Massilia oculi]MCA1855848.1 right-handed parallel beta-helix repeat-containing protein [Massilia oculi]
MKGRRRLSALPAALVLLVLLALAGGALALWLLQERAIAPRTLAPYIAKRSAGHNPLITGSGSWAASMLTRLDRGAPQSYALPPLALGAQLQGVAAPPGRLRPVSDVVELRAAMQDAAPGDVITLAPGSYRVRKAALPARRPGEPGQPIVVRAEQPGSAVLDIVTRVGIEVAAPYWRFENLVLQGACRPAGGCEHAFHVFGKGAHFVARNNTLLDFNAHFKINGLRGSFPDAGLIEGNTIRNETPRKTGSPVTPVDLVAASDWVVRGNLIADFVKLGGDGVSYGAFAKGAAERTLFERNVVVCEQRLHGLPGQRVGLSFGGGGSGRRYCRDGRCITEHEDGIMRGNLVASCSDVGIYLNGAARSTIAHNTLLDTAGIHVRFPTSSAEIEGNLVDGAVLARDGGQLRATDNLQTPLMLQYAGLHAQRGLFADPARLDLRWKRAAPRRAGPHAAPGPDLCGAARPKQAAYGAFENFGACLAPP